MTDEEVKELARIAGLPEAQVAKAMADMKKRKKLEAKKRRDNNARKARNIRKPVCMTEEDAGSISIGHESTRAMHESIRRGSEALLAALRREHPRIVSHLLKQNPLKEKPTGDE